jgi:hypothetical protein
VFEYRVQRRIFEPKRDEMMERWRKLLKEDFMTVLFIKYN